MSADLPEKLRASDMGWKFLAQPPIMSPSEES